MNSGPYSFRPDPEDVRQIDLARARELDRDLGTVDWSHRPDGVHRIDVRAPSGTLATLVGGDPQGERVVLVPGVTGSKEDFILMIPLLGAAGFRVESFDLAGQFESHAAGPRTEHPPPGSYTAELFLRDLLAVIDVGRTPVHLLGYSFAGTLAQVLAAAHPDRVASLTLVSTPPMSGQAFRGVKVLGPASWLASGRVGAALMMWGVRNNLNRAPDHRISFVRRRFELTRRRSVADIIRLMKHTPDVDAAVAALPIPKLVVAGEHDLWPIGRHRAFAERIGAELLVTAGGHSPSEDSPVELTKAVVDLADGARRAD